MGIYDRDWWRDRYNKEPERRSVDVAKQTPEPIESKASWPRALLVLALVVGAGYLLHRQSTPPGAALRRVVHAPAVAAQCADPFPGRGAMASDGEGWKGTAQRGEALFDNQSDSNVVVTLLLNGAPLASVAVPASSQTRLSVPPGSFNWSIAAGTRWCGSSWSFSDARVTNVSGSLDVVPGRWLTVRLEPQGEAFRIYLASRPL